MPAVYIIYRSVKKCNICTSVVWGTVCIFLSLIAGALASFNSKEHLSLGSIVMDFNVVVLLSLLVNVGWRAKSIARAHSRLFPSKQFPGYLSQQQPYPPGQFPPPYQQPYPGPQGQFPPPYQRPKKSSGGMCLILGSLAIIVIAAGIAGYFVIGNQLKATRNANATATTTAYNITHYPFGTTMSYEDTLKGNSPGWPNENNCHYSNLGYQVLLTDTSVYRCINKSQTFIDATYEMTINDLGNVDGAGIIFHYSNLANNNYAYYVALVHKDGTYTLLAVDSRVSTQPYTMDNGVVTDFKPGSPLRLGVTVKGTIISLFADSTMFAQKIVDEQHNYSSGSIGVLIQNNVIRQNAAVVTYTDARIWYLEGSPPIM